MRSRESGFTLVEIVITTGITLILLAAGGVWMMSMQPGALRSAVDDVDANFAAAQSIAESSGSGATLVFAPRPNGAPGFTLRVYSGRPSAANAVSVTNVMAVSSATAVTEAHFGKPPFTMFLNSAGYATGTANYPALDAQGNPTFNVIGQQPPCPAGGIQLTFTSPQGATATRTYACNTLVAGTAAASATPTPNPIRVSPTYLLAHDTTDSGPLRFKAAEYGYYHWYASTSSGAACKSNVQSDSGAAPVTFASPWPYAAASPAAQAGSSPAPPESAPYTWPAGDPNDPPAWFELSPVLHNGGTCTVAVSDDYGQTGIVSVQVMGDLTPSSTSVSLQVGKGSQSVSFSKTFDSEALTLAAGGPCGSIVSVQTQPGATPSSPGKTPALEALVLTPVAKGSCTMIVQDQYGEKVALGINVAAPDQPFDTWPASLVVGANGAQVGTTTGQLAMTRGTALIARIAPLLNAAFGGGIARAAGYSGACYAQAFASGTSGTVDTSLPASVAAALGITVTTDGCILNANGSAPFGGATPTGVMAAYEPVASGQSGTFEYNPLGCGGLNFGSWTPPNASGAQASLPAAGLARGQCSIDFSDGQSTQTPAPDAGQVAVTVNPGGCENEKACVVAISGAANSFNLTTHGTETGYDGTAELVFVSFDGGATWDLAVSKFSDSQGTDYFTGSPSTDVSGSPVFEGTWSGDPDVACGCLSAVPGTVTWDVTPPSYVTSQF